MSWRPIDFQGLIDLNQKIVEQLDQYLKEKETRLAHHILHIIQPLPTEAFAPLLPFIGTQLKLSEAVEGFSKQVRFFIKGNINQIPHDNGERVVKELNAALWEFTEVLEGCVIELFQQIKQVNIDRWHVSIYNVVHSIKDMLIHLIEDLIWVIRRLERPLREYCQKCQKKEGLWKLWGSFWKTYLDPDLIHNLKQSEIFLKKHYEAFNRHYSEYMHLSIKVEDSLKKMQDYPILALMDVPDQNLYIDIFRLLKMFELNRQPKEPLAHETIRSLKNLVSVDKAIKNFRIYYRELKDAFFKSSLELKSFDQDKDFWNESRDKLKSKVVEYQHELQQLIKVMSRFRSFMLKTDPNPYIRSRWGFTEWIVAPEPAKAKKLLNLIYAAEELNLNYGRFLASLNETPVERQQRENNAHQEIEKILHEMGQPLISRSMMSSRVERLLALIKECDEVGSSKIGTIQYIEDILAKAMREDWKYHVLHEFQEFHEIYRIHQGLAHSLEDPAHAFRMERFHLLFVQIEDWIKKGDLYTHVHEIELDINDMKTYLQDFLAAVQRLVRDKSNDPFLDESIHKFRQQLLEYRYVFGQFFFIILSKDSNGKQLRNQFLFVDQYFESIENLLYELKSSWEGKR